MSFIGAKVEDFTSKSGKNIVLRYICEDDAEELCRYINELSQEDTYIRFSGEVISLEDEHTYLKAVIERLERGDCVALVAVCDDRIVGHSSIERNMVDKKRSLHIGDLGLSIAANCRGDGIGLKLVTALIRQAKERMHNLKMIRLTVFELNTAARSLYTKVGFIEFSRLPKANLRKGEYTDEIGMYLEVKVDL